MNRIYFLNYIYIYKFNFFLNLIISFFLCLNIYALYLQQYPDNYRKMHKLSENINNSLFFIYLVLILEYKKQKEKEKKRKTFFIAL